MSSTSNGSATQGAKAASVRVVARIRPNWDAKTDPNTTNCVDKVDESNALYLKTGENYRFSSVLGSDSTQSEAYRVVCGWNDESETSQFITEALNGFNTTVIAYGQTGSGKTHTMMGDNEDGIIPRLARDLFTGLENLSKYKVEGSGALNITVRVSFVEIYRERLRDLLNVMSSKPLRIREGDRKVVVEGVTEEYVTSDQELLEVMRRGNSARSVAATRMNEDSSRSHSVFTLKIEQQDIDQGNTIESKIQLVDLAGSEQVKRTGAAGDRLEEAKAINLSLSCLGNVVSALVEKKPFVPYRDSKLTRLLQDSLGGTAKTCLIVTMSPMLVDELETLSTLRFGQRAQKVQNQVVKNVKRTADELERLLAKAEEEIRMLKSGNTVSATVTTQATISMTPEDVEKMDEMQSKIEDLELALDKSRKDLDDLQTAKSDLEKSKKKLELEYSETMLREQQVRSDLDLVRQELEESKKPPPSNHSQDSVRSASMDPSQFAADVTLLTEKCVKYQMVIMEKDEEIEFLKEAKLDQVWIVLRETEQKLKTSQAERDKAQSELQIARMQLKNRQELLDTSQLTHAKIQKSLLAEIDSLEHKLQQTTQELKNYRMVVEGATKQQQNQHQQALNSSNSFQGRSVVVSKPVRVGPSVYRSSPSVNLSSASLQDMPKTPQSVASLKDSFFNANANNDNNNLGNDQSLLSNSFESFVEENSLATSSPRRQAQQSQAKDESMILPPSSNREQPQLDESALSIVSYTANDHQRASDLIKLKLLPERHFFFDSTTKINVKQEWKLDGRGGTELGFGSAVYPAAVALSFLIASKKHVDLKGKRVLELGTGTGVVGLCASMCCEAGFVCVTDGDEATVELAQKNFELNQVDESKFMARKLLWGSLDDMSDLDNSDPFEVILASDIVALPYKDSLPLLLQTLVSFRDRFKSASSSGDGKGKFEILLAYTPRSVTEEEFFDWLRREQFEVTKLEGEELIHADFANDDSIQIFSIT